MRSGVLLDRGRDTSIRVPFAQHRIDRAAEHLGVLRLDLLLLVGLRILGVVRDGEALLLQLLDRVFELRDRRTDVGQLDDVGVRCFGERTELGEIVRLPPFGGQALRKVGEDPTGKRDVARLHHDASGPREGLDDRQQRVGGEGGRFIGVRVDDLCGCHVSPESVRTFHCPSIQVTFPFCDSSSSRDHGFVLRLGDDATCRRSAGALRRSL